MFGKIIAPFKKFLNESFLYYTQCEEEIMIKNITLLRKLCIIYTIIFSMYFIASYFIYKSITLNIIYLIFLILQIFIDIYVLRYFKKNKFKFKFVQLLCFLIELCVMIFIILISIFPFPGNPAIYFPIILVSTSVFFIFSFKQILLILFGLETVFYILSFNFKTTESFYFDVLASVSSLILAILCAYVVYDLRIQEYKAKLELKQLSSIDDLTGVYNKATAEHLCRDYLSNADKDSSCVLFVIDIDNFKDINDTLGHLYGDEALRQVGSKLKALFRPDDIIGRIGGDEFIIMMTNISDFNIVEKKVQQVVDQIASIFLSFTTRTLSCSVGVAMDTDLNIPYDKLFVNADKALYKAKSRGKNQYVIYTNSLKRKNNKPIMLIIDDKDLSTAILSSIFDEEYCIKEANNEVQAIEIINHHYKTISVIILNIEMLEKAGHEILNFIKNEPKLRNIPVMVITNDSTNMFSSLEFLNVDLVLKPFDPLVIKNRVESVIRKKNTKNQ